MDSVFDGVNVLLDEGNSDLEGKIDHIGNVILFHYELDEIEPIGKIIVWSDKDLN